MNVITKNNQIRFQAVNDLEFVFKNIPIEIEDRQPKMPASTKILVALEIDGFYRKTPFFDKELEQEKLTIEAMREYLKVEKDDFSLTRVHVVQTFSMRLTLSYEAKLGECTGKEIVDALKERIAELKDLGFTTREPALEDAE